MSAEVEIDNGWREESTMVADLIAILSCPWHGHCSPRCRHCAASDADVAAARAWLASHPGSVAAWRARRLGEIALTFRLWEASESESSGSWAVRATEDGAIVADGLSTEQASAIADAHNGEREAALVILDWFMTG